MASPNYIIFLFPPPSFPFPKNKAQNNFESPKSSAFEQGIQNESRNAGTLKCHTLFAVHMVPVITHCLGISATRCAQAGASPLIGLKLDLMGLVPQVLMGGRQRTP